MTAIDIKTLGRSSLTGGVAQLWRILSRFILTPIIIGELGMEGYGVWALVFSVAAYVEMSNVGLGLAYTKFTAECVRHRRYEELTHIIGSGIALVGWIAVVGLIAAWVFGEALLIALNVPPHLVSDASVALLIVVGMMLLRMTMGCCLEVLSGLQRIDLTFRLYVLASIVDFVVAVPLLLLGWGLMGLATAHAVGQITINVAAFVMVRKRLPQVRISPRYVSREGIRKIASVGGRFQMLSIFQTVVRQGAKLLISGLVGVEFVGIYELADKLITLGRTASGAVIAPLMPAFASLQAAKEKARERMLFLKGSMAAALLGGVAFAFLALFGPDILLLWTGREVPLAAWTLQVLAVAQVAALLTPVVSSSLRAQGKVGLEFRWAVLTVGVLVVLVIPLAKAYGFEGVIIARLVSQIISTTWYLSAYFKYSGMSWRDYLGGTRIARLMIILLGVAALIIAVRWALPPFEIPALSPRWRAVVEVGLWSVPYLGLLSVLVWKVHFDDDDREQMAILGAAIFDRLRGRDTTPAYDVIVVLPGVGSSAAIGLVDTAGALGLVGALDVNRARQYLERGTPLRVLLVPLTEGADPNRFLQWLGDHRPDLLPKLAFVGGDAEALREHDVVHYLQSPSRETLLADWPPPKPPSAN